MNEFKKDINYLLNYCIQTVIIFSFLNIMLLILKGYSFQIELNSADFIYLFIAILLCGLPSSILHNCAHKNFKPKKLNSILGEICGTIMLYGYKSFSLGHMFHHIYPDSPDYDVHSPRGYNFFSFLISPVKDTVRVVQRAYYERFGKNEMTEKKIKTQIVLFQLSVILKVIFLFLLLGPKIFVVFYLPLYIANLFVFAHINFVTHRLDGKGDYEVVNLNHNIYYKVVNFLSCGGYFHKSHHEKPQYLNPMNAPLSNKSYITYKESKHPCASGHILTNDEVIV